MTTVPLADLPGFRILSHAGKGGLGDVFVAERVSTGGKVAIKLLRDNDNSGDVERRIRREVEAMVALKGHPGVVQIEEVISTRKGPALVMEYAEDGSLQGLIHSHGHFSTAETVEIGVQVAQLLADAHVRGIIHRDIKPHNILRTAFGQYKVCDFGIASLTRTPGWAEHTSAISYRYASPEEVDGSSVGPSSDIYSLGVTLVQTRAGTTEGLRSGAALSFANESGVDAALANVLRKMTDIDPARRPDASNVIVGLRAVVAAPRSARTTHDPADADETVRRSAPPRPEIRTDGLPGPTTDVKWWENQ